MRQYMFGEEGTRRIVELADDFYNEISYRNWKRLPKVEGYKEAKEHFTRMSGLESMICFDCAVYRNDFYAIGDEGAAFVLALKKYIKERKATA